MCFLNLRVKPDGVTLLSLPSYPLSKSNTKAITSFQRDGTIHIEILNRYKNPSPHSLAVLHSEGQIVHVRKKRI
jgi:hypothetical protein